METYGQRSFWQVWHVSLCDKHSGFLSKLHYRLARPAQRPRSAMSNQTPSRERKLSLGLQRRHTDPTGFKLPTLRQVLQNESCHPFTLAQFRGCVAKEHALEALEFYLAVEMLAHIPREHLMAQCMQLIVRFIQEYAPQAINIDARLRQRIIAEPSVLNLAEAQEEMFRLLEENTFRRFIKMHCLHQEASLCVC
ncbi:RGS domain-containing protein [Protomyces lactucae-debilis]|uniref:RGS domain-containing protein n=1 Tax=Protomyces lactucae-debilis TaxID=2754530 RepID=A0A1Y2FYC7_PROLT|nr:RGS domain-containing protein [Protomyces lactucae-debilis]ORY87685.1 RGS domain-containing protein [Protomyces lactucae-debilis]